MPSEKVMPPQSRKKTKEQLIEELLVLQQRCAEFESLETERTKAVEALQESEERFRRMADNIQDGLTIVENHKTVYVNERMCEISGYAKEDLLSQGSMGMLTPESRKEFQNIFDKYQRTGIIPKETEYEIVRKDGTRRNIYSRHSVCRKGDKTLGYYDILTDVTERKLAEEKLKTLNQQLEQRVQERTSELTQANERLKKEIAERVKAEEILKAREQELNIKTGTLEELNAALRVLLKKGEDDKIELQEQVMDSVRGLVLPYLERLGNSSLEPQQRECLNIAGSNLNDILSPFVNRLSSGFINLTPQEIKLANLIQEGKTTKDIAFFLNLSIRTVDTHRENIRRKLGINNKKTNLRTHLSAFK